MKKILNAKIVVGHSLLSDFDVLNLTPFPATKSASEHYSQPHIEYQPPIMRDISEFSRFKKVFPMKGEKRRLKDLAKEVLNARV